MLSSSLLFSILKPAILPPNLPSKDTGIFNHTLTPTPKQNLIYKKSSTAPNCLAISPTHIFAAQADKALVQVYNRETGVKEADVPFGEKITSCLFVGLRDGGGIGVLVLGMDGGRIILWEICTGRQVSTPPAHLESVTCLAIDSTRNFLLSGSKDHNVHIWSLPNLMSFATQSRTPWKTFFNHRGSITSLVVGHSQLSSDFVISASEDKTILLWDYRTATKLATFLASSVPRCLALDAADRAFYIGYEDHVQFVDLHKISFDTPNEAREVGDSGRWAKEQSPLLCLSVSPDGAYIYTGHQDGKVLKRTTPRGQASEVCDTHLPVTNIIAPLPTGFLYEKTPATKPVIVKPKLDMNSKNEDSLVPERYEFNAIFSSRIPIPRYDDEDDDLFSDFDTLLEHPSFPDDLLYAPLTLPSKSKAGELDEEAMEEFHSLKRENKAALAHVADLADEVKRLQDQEAARQRRKKLKRLRKAKVFEAASGRPNGRSNGDVDMDDGLDAMSSDSDDD